MTNLKRLIQSAMLILTAMVILVLTTFGCKRAAPQMVPPEVLVMDVVQKDVPIYGDWIGTLDGLVNARIHAQVSGYLMAQHYQEGSLVHKGDLLFQIDPRPFQAALDKAKGQMAEAQANSDMTAINVRRYTPLAKNNAISQQELDNAIQSNKGAQAALESAQAAVQQAKLNLEFTKVTSPIDGIAGIAEAQIGDLVGPNSSELTAISTVNPIKAYFPISEQEYMKAMDRRMTQNIESTVHSTNSLELILADGNTYPYKGTIVFADRQVNIRTGTIRVAGLFPNPDNILRPGQYAHIRMVIQMHKDALLVPQRAVTDMQGNYQVVVVDKNNRSSIRTVVVGERSGALWIVKQGLNSGERVVVEGTQKVREGTIVNPKPYQPDIGKASVTGTNIPTPVDSSTP